MLLIPLIVAVAIGTHQDGGSLLTKLFPNPTGRNGYEDYVAACDMIDRDLWGAYDQWLSYLYSKRPGATGSDAEDVPPIPPKVSPEMTDLQVRKIMDDQFGGAIRVVAQGNRKAVIDPHLTVKFDTTFPEYSGFKLLEKIDVNRAHMEFADGHSTLAVKDLLEGLRLSSSMTGTIRISALVAVASQSIVLAEFERDLGLLSYYDAKDVEKACKELLAKPQPMADIIRSERDLEISDLDHILDKPGELFSEPKDESTVQEILNLSPNDRQQLKSLVSDGLNSRMAAEYERFSGPETGWVMRDQSSDPIENPNDHSVSNLALKLVNALEGKDLLRNYSNGIGKGRIQLRLLRLHAQAIEYKWQHNKLPEKLEDFAFDGAGFDPIANAPFHYELKNGTYRIYSLGIPGIGPIELRYRAAAPSAGTAVNMTPPH